MQSKGAIRFVAILLLLASLWQLSFTLVANRQENKADKYAEAKAQAAMNSTAFSKVAEADKAFYLDSIRKDENRRYIDSISSEKIYFGYTFKDVKAKAINLGLDLKGGMNVMLEIEVQDLVKSLAGESQNDPTFVAALEQANAALKAGTNDYIGEFAEAYEQISNGAPLAAIFVSPDRKDITPNSTNDEVVRVLRDETDAAIAASFNILRSRIDHFGVTQPNIQRLPNSNRIMVELPGVKEPERVRKLLQGSASLEFWVTYDAAEILPILAEADQLIKQTGEQAAPAAEAEKAEGGKSAGKVLLATVKGDVHDIGKNIVKVLLENYGFEVIDLGKDVAPEKVLEAVKESGAKLVGLSALMTTTV